jgi:type VI secretion system protein ImpH
MSTPEDMQAQPWTYDFFQAMRLIENSAPDLPRVGRSQRLGDDPVRLGQQLECTFAPSSLASFTSTAADTPPRLEQLFFGLGGPNGPLPLHITEYLRDRQRNHGDRASKRFLDVFHHRLLSLFYRAWAEARPTVSHDRPDDDYSAARLGALSGRGMPSLLNQAVIPDVAKLHFTGHLSAQTRYPDGLKAILSDYFGLPVAIEEYIGQWLELPDRSRLGVNAHQLGIDLCLGRHVWDRQHAFRIRLGPLTLDEYMGMLPDGVPFEHLTAWVAEYLGYELDWDLNLVLQQCEIPQWRLDGKFRLGFNTWLGTPETDADDLILAPQPAQQTAKSSNTTRKEQTT